MVSYVFTHGGAGYHSKNSEPHLKQAMKLACEQAIAAEVNSLSITESAISYLENDPAFNAGYGSNLTLDGTVECDASIMNDKGSYGAVGAVSGIRNPIRLARKVLDYSQERDSIGRIPPLTLVSAGASAFASRSDDDTTHPVTASELVTEQARSRWLKWKQRLEEADKAETVDELSVMQDTIGAVAYDHLHTTAAGVSSGGLLLKLPGRIGEAAVYGAGCWAASSTYRSFGCSISGAGEHIIRAGLAKSISDAFFQQEDADVHGILENVLIEQFWKPTIERDNKNMDVGVIVMTVEGEGSSTRARLWCAFTSASMAIAYHSSNRKHAKALVLRHPSRQPASSNASPVFITAISL